MPIRKLTFVALITGGLIGPHAVNAEPLKQVVNPAHLSDAKQYGYSHANVVPANAKIVYVAGQVGTAKDGPNDFVSQVDRAFENLLAVLRASGSDARSVVKITLLIKDHDPDKLRYVAKKRRAIFGKTPPASTLIPVTRLYGDGVSFEIDAIAVATKPNS